MNQRAPQIECLSDEQILRWIDDGAPGQTPIAWHIDGCSECQARLHELTESGFLKCYQNAAKSPWFHQTVLGRPTEPEALGALGDYSIVERIGAGGMGAVYRALDDRLEREVAIKVLTNVSSPVALARFERETKAQSKLDHQNIVSVYGSGQTEAGIPYLVMPLVAGDSLKTLIAAETLDMRTAADYVRQAAVGLDAAHQAGLVHRDVKPANILVDRDGVAKLVDFGLVRGEQDPTLTQTDILCGTPEYMSPEQASSLEDADARSDVYSLGVTLYECLTGTVPFRGRPIDVLMQHRDLEPTRPSRLNLQVPIELETICSKAMHKESTRRYATSLAFADDLQQWLNGKPISARPTSQLQKSVRWAKQNRALATSLGLLFLVLLSSTIVSTTLWRQSQRNAQEAFENNQSLRENQRVLRDNQVQLGEALRNSYLTTINQDDAYMMELPIAVRNTILIEMAQAWRLLFERSERQGPDLLKMIRELNHAAEFALEHNMFLRTNELAELNREIVDRYLQVVDKPEIEALIAAARGYNRFAEARLFSRHPKPTDACDRAMELAKSALDRIDQEREPETYLLALLESVESQRLKVKCLSGQNGDQSISTLLSLRDAIRDIPQVDALEGRRLSLEQRLCGDLSRSDHASAVEHVMDRVRALEKKQLWQQKSGQKTDWTERKIGAVFAEAGMVWIRNGNREEARKQWLKSVEQFERLISFNPLNVQFRADIYEVNLLLANLEWDHGEQEAAVAASEKAIENMRLSLQINRNDYIQTRRVSAVFQQLGKRYLDAGLGKEAAELFHEAAKRLGGRLSAIALMKNTSIDGDIQLAKELFQGAADAFQSAGLEDKRAQALEALEALKEKYDEGPDV